MFKFDTSQLTASVADAMNKLTAATGEETLRAAGFAGARVFREGAKERLISNGSVITGTLLRNIIVKRMEEKSDANKRQTYLVTVRSGVADSTNDAYYWRWVEAGHSFVRRKPKSGGASWAAHREASRLEYGSASAPAKPFMRPTYDSKQDEALAAMKKTLAEQVQEKTGGL